MSELKFHLKNKFTRLIASSAICGLSISFVMGESLDANSHRLTDIGVDYSLSPIAFPVFAPIERMASLYKDTNWKQSVETHLATQNLLAPQERKIETISVVVSEPALTPTINIAGVTEKAAEAQKEQEQLLAAEKVKQEQLAQEKKLHQLLQQIRETTYKLAADDGLVRVSQEKTPKQEEVKITVNTDSPPITARAPQEGPAIVRDEVISASASPEAPQEDSSKVRTIKGKILPLAGVKLRGGHFEIGIFERVNSQGLPIGFPLAQQILPEGVLEYSISAPLGLQEGFLFAHYISKENKGERWFAPMQNPLSFREKALWVGVDIPVQETQGAPAAASKPTLTVASNAKATKNIIKGRILTAFSKTTIYQENTLVRVRGTKLSTTSDSKGEFQLEIPDLKNGVIYLEFLKPGFYPAMERVDLPLLEQSLQVEIASKEAIDRFANLLGLRQNSTKSILLAKVSSEQGAPLQGVSAQLSLRADGPYYFSGAGVPVSSSELRATGADGRFIFFNVDPGVGFLEQNHLGETIAPVLVSAVESGGVLNKNMRVGEARLRGRIMNPVAGAGTKTEMQFLSNMKVRLEGGSDWTRTDTLGNFEFAYAKYAINEELSVEVSGEKFYNHRFLLRGGQWKKKSLINLFVFPAAYISKLAGSVDIDLDPYSGLIIGGVGRGKNVRMDALSEHTKANDARDFYFDEKGALKGSFSQTHKDFGTFVIFNVPRGGILLQGLNRSSKLEFTDFSYSTASTVNVVLPE